MKQEQLLDGLQPLVVILHERFLHRRAGDQVCDGVHQSYGGLGGLLLAAIVPHPDDENSRRGSKGQGPLKEERGLLVVGSQITRSLTKTCALSG